MPDPSVVYLHGFASSPYGMKGDFLAGKLAACGIDLIRPDLNVPDFAHLSVATMLGEIARTVAACPDGPLILVGSSLGGFAATHFMGSRPEAARVTGLLFLAPAFEPVLGAPPALRWWVRLNNGLRVYHYGLKRRFKVHRAFFTEVRSLDSYAVRFDAPLRILHGSRDEAVPVRQSERFAAGRPNVTLRVLDTDHQMGSALDMIWADLVDFASLNCA